MRSVRMTLRRAAALVASALAITGIVTVAGAAPSSASPAGSATLTAASQPAMPPGATNQAAGDWTLTFPALSTWSLNDTVTISVQDHSGSGNHVTFHAKPTVTAVSNSPNPAPTFSTALNGTSTALVITFTNSSSLPITTAQKFTVSAVAYDVSASAATGPVSVAASYTPSGGSPSAVTASGASNAVVAGATVSANNPPVGVPPSTSGAPISDVVVTELKAGGVPTGWVCVTLSAGTFDKNAAPTITANGGGAVVGNSVSGSGTATATYSFDVTTASSTGAATYTLGGLAVDAPSTAQEVTIAVQDAGAAAGCASATNVQSGVRAYGALSSDRIFGPTADDTAAAELEAQFVPGTNCPPSRGAVLATDASYPDALAASYLAGYLNSGILLTPTDTVSTAALDALKAEGIEQVYVVGGPLAVSDADVNQINSTAAYNCGGVTPAGMNMTVQRIGGATLYDTAAMIADAIGASYVGTAAFPGAYGQYNDVGGASSSSASTGTTKEPTAIIATGNGFQDAMSASPVAYAQAFPVLLTDPSFLEPQSEASLTSLGIKQVIVMGGSQAISDAVVTQIQGMGIEVLRVAGVDYTDTSVQLAAFELNSTDSNGSTDGLDWQAGFKNLFDLTRGDFYADGLAGCVVAGKRTQPMLLTFDPNTVGQYLTALLNQVGASGLVLGVTVFGGTSAVTDATVQTVLDALAHS